MNGFVLLVLLQLEVKTHLVVMGTSAEQMTIYTYLKLVTSGHLRSY